MLTKLHGNILNLSENIAKSFRRGATFFDSHCIQNECKRRYTLHPLADRNR